MKTSWNRCIEFSNMAQAYLKRTEGQESKLSYAINRVLSRLQKEQAVVSEALSDIEIDYCLTEKRGDNEVITRDAQGNLEYTKQGIKDRNKARRAYLNTEDVEIEPYFATSLPKGLNEFELEAFTGFVIREEDAEAIVDRESKVEPALNGHQQQVATIAG